MMGSAGNPNVLTLFSSHQDTVIQASAQPARPTKLLWNREAGLTYGRGKVHCGGSLGDEGTETQNQRLPPVFQVQSPPSHRVQPRTELSEAARQPSNDA